MKISRTASAAWEGNIKEGTGVVSTGSGALQDQPYGFSTRFEDKQGTNPEELIGAALASCYSMALSLHFTENGFIARQINTSAEVFLEKQDENFTITQIHLTVTARVPGLDEETFASLAEKTRKECPVSKALNTDIVLSAKLLT